MIDSRPPTTNERAHSRLGASNAKRWMSCPGSVAACDALPPSPSSPDSELGTAAHALAESCLRAGVSAETRIGSTVERHVVDEEMAAAVQVYLDEVRRQQEASPSARLFVEERVSLAWMHPEMFGTLDAMLVEPWGAAVVIDYKHGAGIAVEAEGNPQLAYYALDAFHRFDCTSVDVVIVQPRCPHPDGPIRRAVYTRGELAAWADRFAAAAVTATTPGAPRRGGEHCRFCPAASTCPALHRHAVAVAQAEFAPLIQPPAPASLTPAQLRMVLDHADTIDTWIGAVRSHALAVAQGGGEVPGYKLVEGRRGARKWTDEGSAGKHLEALGIDAWEHSLRSPAAIEKAEGKRGKAALADLDHLMSQTPGRPQLVKTADRRLEITPSAIADFREA